MDKYKVFLENGETYTIDCDSCSFSPELIFVKDRKWVAVFKNWTHYIKVNDGQEN